LPLPIPNMQGSLAKSPNRTYLIENIDLNLFAARVFHG
jgi:hypothetical protein